MAKPKVNKYGLQRRLPPDLKLKLRQECGFGCVICGDAFCDDAHLDPAFENAKEHNVSNMALLCKYHHPDTDLGDLPLSAVIEARKNPKCRSRGFADKNVYMESPLNVKFGSNTFDDVRCIVKTTAGDEWFVVTPPKSSSIYPGINAKFFGSTGNVDFEIIDNEIVVNSVYRNRWTLGTHVWDASLKGRTGDKGTSLEIRKGPKKITLKINFEPPNTINILRLEMKLHESGLLIDTKGNLTLTHNGTSRKFVDNYIGHNESIFLIPDDIEPLKSNLKLYDYACDKCGSKHERRVAFDERHEQVPCLVCRGNPGTLQLQLSCPMIKSSRKRTDRSNQNLPLPAQQHEHKNLYLNNYHKGVNPALAMSMPNTLYQGNIFE